ncbi:hypothetical protein ABT063_16860 [Streptomyces sp. NPDC002838]
MPFVVAYNLGWKLGTVRRPARPDGYVGWAGDSASGLGSYLVPLGLRR